MPETGPQSASAIACLPSSFFDLIVSLISSESAHSDVAYAVIVVVTDTVDIVTATNINDNANSKLRILLFLLMYVSMPNSKTNFSCHSYNNSSAYSHLKNDTKVIVYRWY